MRVLEFMRSRRGRVVRASVGIALVWFGATQATLLGLVLMMVGLMPLVSAALNVCLLDEIVREIVRQRDARAERTREQHVISSVAAFGTSPRFALNSNVYVSATPFGCTPGGLVLA